MAQQQADDASATAATQTQAAVDANNTRVAQKRAYQANLLALGGIRDDSLGGGALSAGATGSSTGTAAIARGAGTSPVASVLGSGAPTVSATGGRARVPAAPSGVKTF